VNFTLRCSCGDTLQIAGTDAACTRRCHCGAEFQIPRLGELRRLEASGETTIAPRRVGEADSVPAPTPSDYLTVAQKLRILTLEKCLPYETHCMSCEVSTQNVLNCFIECELPYAPQTSLLWDHLVTGLMVLLSPRRGLFRLVGSSEDAPVAEGNEVVVPAPLRICPDCATTLHRQKHVVREMLLKMPLYRPLFRQYPDASINIPKTK
jgi:hypothetical protein